MKKLFTAVLAALLALALTLPLAGCTGKLDQYLDLGVRYLSEENYEEAILAFTSAIEIEPKCVAAYEGRGDAYAALGDYEAAAGDYTAAIGLEPPSASVYEKRGDAYAALGDYAAAAEDYAAAIELAEGEQLAALRKKLEDIHLEQASEQERLNGLENTEKNSSENFNFQTDIIDAGMDVDGQYLSVHIRDSRSATITVSGLQLEDSYLTNLSDSPLNSPEYCWVVRMDGAQTTYDVSTFSWAFDPGAEEQRRLEEMQHSVSILESDGLFHYIAAAAMTHTADSITWTFTVPEEYPFDFAQINHYTVTIKDVSAGLNLTRDYNR